MDGVVSAIDGSGLQTAPRTSARRVGPCADRGAGRKSHFVSSEPLNISVWNTFKGRRRAYYALLAEHTQAADLILLQEFRHDPVLESAHAEIFRNRDADMAISFYTMPQQSAPTGVCTVSSVRALRTMFLLSRYFEPVTRTPKMAMCSYYAYDRSDCPPDEALLVLNSHGINFRLRRPFLDQMRQFEEQLTAHNGPIVLVGDFNTWERGRVQLLDAVAERVGLHHVRFPRGIKTIRGHELDRVYVRGGTVANQRVIANAAASDHSMLMFQFHLT
ncbi:MAG: endonuclease/exonuclease/phosphatase family protein [Oscillochloris sp.]|nr:endonuclease/exonuclease/phosphatase family protein [Oscillochloris sp.]